MDPWDFHTRIFNEPVSEAAAVAMGATARPITPTNVGCHIQGSNSSKPGGSLITRRAKTQLEGLDDE